MQEVNRCVVYISLSHRSHSPETSQKKTNKSTSFEVTQATYNLLFIVSYALVGHVKTQKSIFEYLWVSLINIYLSFIYLFLSLFFLPNMYFFSRHYIVFLLLSWFPAIFPVTPLMWIGTRNSTYGAFSVAAFQAWLIRQRSEACGLILG